MRRKSEMDSLSDLIIDICTARPAGRMMRSRYGAALVLWLLVAGIGCFAAARSGSAGAGLILVSAALWFLFSATARRLHDMGRSGLWALVALPLLPLSAVLLLMTESRAGSNRWGENPKGRLRVDDPRLMEKLVREARSGSVLSELGKKKDGSS